ncbi:MAG: cytochrome c oxidase subunit 3 [Longimicrobiales bacterium]
MSTESAAMPARGPAKREPIVPNGVLGMVIFIFTEVMFFSGLISAHTIVKSQAAGQMWPPYGQPRLPIEETALNSLALLVSGMVLVFTWFAFKREAGQARIPLLITIVLGGIFVGFQGSEWAALLADGLTMQSSSYGGFFYLIVGSHAIHAVGALVALLWAYDRLNKDELRSSQLATVSAFWYFVVLVWPILYWQVYL